MAQRQPAKCPSFKEKVPLAGVVLYDGPPEHRADLMPDVSKGTGEHVYASWKVGYVFDQGRKLFLVCRFGTTTSTNTATVQVDKKVESCVFRAQRKGQPAELVCQ